MSPNDNKDETILSQKSSKKSNNDESVHLLSSGDEMSLPDAKEPAVLRDSYVSKHSAPEEESKQAYVRPLSFGRIALEKKAAILREQTCMIEERASEYRPTIAGGVLGADLLEKEDYDAFPFSLQVNFTDTKLSHRFVRFEVPDSLDYDETVR